MEKEIKSLTKDMCNIPDEILARLQSDIAEIKVALLGNEYNPTGGLLCRTTELEGEVAKLKNRYDKIMWMVVGASSVIAFVFNLLIRIADKIL
jgi:hypothetical protein